MPPSTGGDTDNARFTFAGAMLRTTELIAGG
jgi:hypothetical protein